MNWNGKIIGAILGFLFGGPVGLLIGIFIGHLFDSGALGALFSRSGLHPKYQQTQTQQTFFATTFSIMGFLAKADGHVSEKEISAARRVMNQFGFDEASKRIAIEHFTRGKQPQFDMPAEIAKLKKACWSKPSLLRTFLEIQIQMAYADGQVVNNAKRHALEQICQHLGLFGFNFDAFEQQFRAGQNYQRQSSGSQQRYTTRDQLSDAYKILEVDANATDADLKKAYRRQMSKNHPDKLIAQGVPPEMVKIATQKTQQIKRAYETIKQARGI